MPPPHGVIIRLDGVKDDESEGGILIANVSTPCTEMHTPLLHPPDTWARTISLVLRVFCKHDSTQHGNGTHSAILMEMYMPSNVSPSNTNLSLYREKFFPGHSPALLMAVHPVSP